MTNELDNRKDDIREDSKKDGNKDKSRANLLLASILGAIVVIVAGVSIVFWKGATLVQ